MLKNFHKRNIRLTLESLQERSDIPEFLVEFVRNNLQNSPPTILEIMKILNINRYRCNDEQLQNIKLRLLLSHIPKDKHTIEGILKIFEKEYKGQEVLDYVKTISNIYDTIK